MSDWLARYGDQSDAAAMHRLLVSRLPKGVRPPAAPATVTPILLAEPDPVPENIDPPRNDLARNPVLDRTVIDRAERGNASSALRLISATRGISPAYAAQLRSEVAQVLFTRNEDTDALRVAQLALRDTSPRRISRAWGFMLAGWRRGGWIASSWRELCSKAERKRQTHPRGCTRHRRSGHRVPAVRCVTPVER